MIVTASICEIRAIDKKKSTVLLHIIDLGVSKRYGYEGQIDDKLVGVKANVIFHDDKVVSIEKIKEPPSPPPEEKK